MDTLPPGSSSYVLADPRGGGREITVFTHRPASFRADGPVVIVMHGRTRNGDDYRDWWVADAERHGALVIAPRFSERHYAHPDEYNYGAMVEAGRPRPAAAWLFPVIDQVFLDACRKAGSAARRYFLFGHSAGGQVVHRLVTFGWSDRIARAVAANPGSYTMPLLDEEFPFGLKGTGLGVEGVRALLGRPLLILLGESDDDPNHHQLPREPGAIRQGPHRFARGLHYFEAGRRESERLGVPFAWELATVPGVAHSGEFMSPAAASHLFAPTRSPA
jgi:poly(3-hydroxybutyrate) depolymerase